MGASTNERLGDLLEQLGDKSTSRQHRDQALAVYEKLAATFPGNVQYHYYAALERARAGDFEGYRANCSLLMPHINTIRDKYSLDCALWTLALAPDALNDMTTPLSLAEKHAVQEPRAARHLLTYGALLYRNGQYGKAAKQLTESIAADGESDQIYAQLFLAMVKWRMGDLAEGQRILQKVESAFEEEINSEVTWTRRATIYLLHKEAAAKVLSDIAPED
jgi:hypothetical protein